MSKRIVLYTLIPKGFLCGNLRKFKIFFVMHLSMPYLGGERGGGHWLESVTFNIGCPVMWTGGQKDSHMATKIYWTDR